MIDGWAKSPVDPMNVLAVFDSISLKPGFILRAYQFTAGDNGNGIVWAMPSDTPFPEPEDCPRLTDQFLEPPRPPQALDNFMQVVTGDSSAWSYLSASILARELQEFGAMWHGCHWDTHTILGKNPWDKPQSHTIDSPIEAWKWDGPLPMVWKPEMTESDGQKVVSFLTHSGLEQEVIVCHTDVYDGDSYRMKSSEEILAVGPMGYIH